MLGWTLVSLPVVCVVAASQLAVIQCSPRVLGKTLKKLVTSWKCQKCSITVSLITY